MKNSIRRIVGFIEFSIGFTVSILFIYNFLSGKKSNFSFEWRYIYQVPFAILFYGGLMKYGWRWMINTVDIFDEEEIKTDDPSYKEAVMNARQNIELFLCFLRQGEFPCSVLLIRNPKKKNYNKVWAKAQYVDEESILVVYYPSVFSKMIHFDIEKIISIDEVQDWCVIREDMLIGSYLIKALGDRAIANGHKLNSKSKRILNRIIS